MLFRLLKRDKIASVWFGGIALFMILFEVAAFTVNMVYPPCPSGRRFEMPRPFNPNGGASYYTSLPGLEQISDESENFERSTVMVCEGNLKLGPAHAGHVAISELGRGRFSHWGGNIVFSASDNSDPNTNGRGYLAILPDKKVN